MKKRQRGEQWGAGSRDHWRFLDERNQFQDGTPFRVFFGEHPHSRDDNRFYAEVDGEAIAFDGHRVRTKVIIEEANYLKVSGLSGSEIRKQASADVYFNDKFVYRVSDRRRAEDLLLRAHQVIGQLYEHPVQLWRDDWDGLVSRRVWYQSEPAIVTAYMPDRGVVELRHANNFFPAPVWNLAREATETVLEEFLSPRIYWFRKDCTHLADSDEQFPEATLCEDCGRWAVDDE